MSRTSASDLVADLLALGHNVHFEARGDSMDPIIRSGDRLEVVPLTADMLLRRGTVVLTRSDRGLTAHRVIACSPGTVITRGDNVRLADRPVPREQVIGLVTAIVSAGRRRPVRRLMPFGLALVRTALRLRRRLRRALQSI